MIARLILLCILHLAHRVFSISFFRPFVFVIQSLFSVFYASPLPSNR
jgi:hypothetical protein